MTAAAVTKALNFNTQHVMPVWLKFYKAATTDFIDTSQLTPAYKGFFPLNAFSFSATACTALPLMQPGMGAIVNAGTAYTATDTTIAVDNITPYVAAYPRIPPYYILAQDAGTTAFEIMEVITDSLPATAATSLTVKRGCLGTTAMVAGVANASKIFFLNILMVTDATIGTVLCYGVPFPAEPKSPAFVATPR